jgi:hypothetical protein
MQGFVPGTAMGKFGDPSRERLLHPLPPRFCIAPTVLEKMFAANVIHCKKKSWIKWEINV